MAELRDVEIFRTGTWTDSAGNTRTFSQADLEQIRDKYDPAVQEAPAVLGHPKDNAPAYGWAHNLRIKGGRLAADFRQCAEAFVEAVKAGRFKKRSISLRPDFTLRHVAWLGAALPAVEGLKDVAFSGNADASEYTFSESGQSGPATMEEETMKTELEKLTDAVSVLRADLAAIKDGNQAKDFSQRLDRIEDSAKKAVEQAEAKAQAADEAKAKAENGLAEFQETQVKKDRIARFEKLVASGKALPADKDKTLAFAEALAKSGDQEMEFSAPDGKTEKVGAEEAYWRDMEAKESNGLLREFSALVVGDASAATVNNDLGRKV